jgi:hypothetical protein
MQSIKRQQKRAALRLIEKKRLVWSVPNWQPMKFIEMGPDPDFPEADVALFKNNLYIAFVRKMKDGIFHISFRNMENSTDISWPHKQQIKNDICGREREAIEIFPAMSRIVDAANQYHLWVYPEGYIIPTGFPNISLKKKLQNEI